MNKDVGFRVRVERQLRDDFVSACRQRGERAADVLRRRMVEYLEEESVQGDLFGTVPVPYRPGGGQQQVN